MEQENNNFIEDKCGGIYFILNIFENKVYVGQAKDFDNRTHISNLYNGQFKEKRHDNINLQNDYNDPVKNLEFVYFPVSTTDEVFDKKDSENKKILDTYEKLYMTLMEQTYGYELYNIQIPDKNRKLEKLKSNLYSESVIEEAKTELENDFKEKFGLGVKELRDATIEEKKSALEYYVNRKLEGKISKKDRLFYNRNRIASIFEKYNSKSQSITKLPLNELFYSPAGNYVGEGIEQILYQKLATIKENGYCLWAVANNSFTINNFLKKHSNKESFYVLFKFTPSTIYASTLPYIHKYIRKKNNPTVDENAIKSLNLTELKRNIYELSETTTCTASSSKSSKAFVIDQLFLLNEDIDMVAFNSMYKSYANNGEISEDNRIQQKTALKVKVNENSINDICIPPNHRSLCFAARLVAPYVLHLNVHPK